MRISEWSSDVCSSDLAEIVDLFADLRQQRQEDGERQAGADLVEPVAIAIIACPQGDGGWALLDDEEQRRELEQQPDRLRQVMDPADPAKAIGRTRHHYERADDMAEDRKRTRLNSSH